MTFVAFLYPICPLLYPVHIESDMQCSECCSQLYSLSTMWFFFAPGHCISLLYAPTSIVLCFYWLCKCTSQSTTVMARLHAPWMARLQHNFLNTVMNHSCIAQAESNNGFQRAAALFSCYTCRTLFACRYSPETFLRPSVSCLQRTWANSCDNLKAPLELYHHCFTQKKLHKHIHVHFYSFKIPPEANFI